LGLELLVITKGESGVDLY